MDDRDRTAADRDLAAAAHDASALDRDVQSDARDARAEARDERHGHTDVQAASDRAGARRDRKRAASDRKQAEDDRSAAQVDRRLSAVQRSGLQVDSLTQAYTRDAGMIELDRELLKAQRTGEDFVLAFVDVDDLKAINDSQGHDAGDRLLSQVAAAIQKVVRDYDVVVRYGGDEFVCGLAGVALADAAPRFARLNEQLRNFPSSASVGLAQFNPGEDLASLIDRADKAMYRSKSGR